jgi:hypothetical protein
VGTYVWNDELRYWEFDSYSAGEDTSPSLYEGESDDA